MQSHVSFKTKIERALRIDRALGLVWQSAPGWTVAHLVVLIIHGLLPLLSLYLMKLLIDGVAAGINVSAQGIDFKRVIILIVMLGAVFLVNTLISSLSGLIGEIQGQVVTDHMHGIIHSKSIAVDLAYYEDSKYYDTLHRAQQEVVVTSSMWSTSHIGKKIRKRLICFWQLNWRRLGKSLVILVKCAK